jgi:AraC-like DNA-binding protein
MQMIFFLYPLEVINPVISRTKVYALLFLPLLLLVSVGMCGGIEYTPIHSYDDLWLHLGEFNVWFRLLTLVVMFLYTFALFLVPYDWHHSSADRKFILRYASGFCLIGLLHFTIQATHAYLFVLLHQVVWMSFFFWVAWYELKERLLSPAKYETLPVAETNPDDDELWQKIVHLMDEEEGWFNPEITQADLATKLFSNRTYIADAFKRNTGMTFKDYQTKRRVDFMVQQLQLNPQTDMQDLFFRVGYRDRSTAWRNFRKVMGMSPTEFLETLK